MLKSKVMNGCGGEGRFMGSPVTSSTTAGLAEVEQQTLISLLRFSMTMRRATQYDNPDILNRGAAAGTDQACRSGR